MFTVRILRPGSESRTSLHSFFSAVDFANDIIVSTQEKLFEVSIVDEERNEEVQIYYSDRERWVAASLTPERGAE